MSRKVTGFGVWGLVLAVVAMPALAEAPKSPLAEPAKVALAPVAGKATRVLFIGNSFTSYNGGLGSIVQSLAAKGGHKLDFVEVTKGGETLEGHWKTGKAQAAIQKGGWDYVVLQEQSVRPITDPAKMAEYVKLFDAEIKKVGAKTLLYETWATIDKPETQAVLCKTYESIAKEINAIVAPAGRAWEIALKAKPDLKLHVIKDKKHPTPAGSYLNACVMYATIFGQEPADLPWKIKSAAGKALFELPEIEAVLLQKSAQEMLTAWKKTLDAATAVPAALGVPAPAGTPANSSGAGKGS